MSLSEIEEHTEESTEQQMTESISQDKISRVSELNSKCAAKTKIPKEPDQSVSGLRRRAEKLASIFSILCKKQQRAFVNVNLRLTQRLKTTTNNSRFTFNNIEVETIAREKIIPYVSEVFLNASRLSRSSSKTVESNNNETHRSILRRSRNERSIVNRQELREILRLERFGKRLALRIGFNAITKHSPIGSLTEASSVVGTSMHSSKQSSDSKTYIKAQLGLPTKIIKKYMQKMLLYTAFCALRQPLVAFRVAVLENVLSQALVRRLAGGFKYLRSRNHHSKQLAKLANFLTQRSTLWRTHSMFQGFFRIRMFNRNGHQKPAVLKALSTLFQLFERKQLKFLFSGFMKIQ